VQGGTRCDFMGIKNVGGNLLSGMSQYKTAINGGDLPGKKTQPLHLTTYWHNMEVSNAPGRAEGILSWSKSKKKGSCSLYAHPSGDWQRLRVAKREKGEKRTEGRRKGSVRKVQRWDARTGPPKHRRQKSVHSTSMGRRSTRKGDVDHRSVCFTPWGLRRLLRRAGKPRGQDLDTKLEGLRPKSIPWESSCEPKSGDREKGHPCKVRSSQLRVNRITINILRRARQGGISTIATHHHQKRRKRKRFLPHQLYETSRRSLEIRH